MPDLCQEKGALQRENNYKHGRGQSAGTNCFKHGDGLLFRFSQTIRSPRRSHRHPANAIAEENPALMKQLRYKAVEQKRSDEAPAQQGGRAKYALLAATDPRRSGWQDGEWWLFSRSASARAALFMHCLLLEMFT